MSNQKIEIKADVLEAYDNQYKSDLKEWRDLGGEFKANNIISLAKGLEISNMLDVGSGDGSVLEWLEQLGFLKNATSLEISTSGIEKIKALNLKNLSNTIQFDGYSLPLQDKEFDLAMCSHVIEHVEFPRTVLREIKRVSKYQVFEVPIDFSFKVDKQVAHYLAYGHINIYTPQQFKFLLQSEGFEIVKEKPSMHSKGMIDYLYKANRTKLLKERIKKSIFNNSKFLLNTFPNVFTVLTKSTDKGMEIFQDGFNGVQ